MGFGLKDETNEAINNFQIIGKRCKGIQQIDHVVTTIKRKIGVMGIKLKLKTKRFKRDKLISSYCVLFHQGCGALNAVDIASTGDMVITMTFKHKMEDGMRYKSISNHY